MAKKREVNYFKELSTDKELDEFLKREGLIIIDIYQDLFGPCNSLHGSIEKAKLTQPDSERIQLANCDAFKIHKLKRWFGNCRPTILFCERAKVVDVCYGADIPLVLRTIQKQLEESNLCAEGKASRILYKFSEPVAYEKEILEREFEEREVVDRVVREKLARETKKKLTNAIDLMKYGASDMSVTLFMPHVADEAIKKITEVAKWLSMSNKARRMIKITPEIFTELNRFSENPINDAIVEYLKGKEVLAVLWAAFNPEEVLTDFVRIVSEPQALKDENGENVPDSMQPAILESLYIPIVEELDEEDSAYEEKLAMQETRRQAREEKQSKAERTERISKSSKDSKESLKSSNEEKVPKKSEDEKSESSENLLEIPPVWTPLNYEGSAILKYFYFHKFFEHFLPPLPDVVPDHLLMVFPASKHEEIFSISKKFPEGVLDFGFFKENTRSGYDLICKSTKKYSKVKQTDNDRIVMNIAKKTSHFSLALTAINPVYVSHNVAAGLNECKEIFNEYFQAYEDT